uniref:Uncharacterized protein n=1 Tax=Glossina pallidipes TaxID=7398 RepID=A0A1A9ZLX3_GLOPL
MICFKFKYSAQHFEIVDASVASNCDNNILKKNTILCFRNFYSHAFVGHHRHHHHHRHRRRRRRRRYRICIYILYICCQHGYIHSYTKFIGSLLQVEPVKTELTI